MRFMIRFAHFWEKESDFESEIDPSLIESSGLKVLGTRRIPQSFPIFPSAVCLINGNADSMLISSTICISYTHLL